MQTMEAKSFSVRGDSVKTALRHFIDSKSGAVFRSLVIGVLSGLAVVLFRFLLDRADNIRRSVYTALAGASIQLYFIWAIFLMLVGLLSGFLIKRHPMIRGSGIPQLKGAMERKLHMAWWPELAYKLGGGVLAIGCGLSLGREGPSVQLGAYTAQALTRVMKRPETERKYLITSGAAAGLAAAFNAPLAGVLFALEELHKHFSPFLILCTMAGSVAGDLVAGFFFGLRPVFDFHDIDILPLAFLPCTIILGFVCAILGELFKRSLYSAQNLFIRMRIPIVFRPVLPLLLSIIPGVFLYDAIGGGHHLIMNLAKAVPALPILLILLACKLIFTSLSYGSGAPGGIFLPLLAIGAIIGASYSRGLVLLGFSVEQYHLNFIILGMAGLFTSVVRAPLTGTILILEMCGNLDHFSGIIACSLSAFAFGALFKAQPVYDVLLERILKGGAEPYRPMHRGKSLIHEAVEDGSCLCGQTLGSIELPEGAVIAAIERNEDELVGHPKLILQAGDKLVILCEDNIARATREAIKALCSTD